MKIYYTKLNAKVLVFLCLLFLLSSMTSCQKYLDAKPSSKLDKMSPEYVQELLDDYVTMNSVYPGDIETCSDDYFLLDGGYNGIIFLKADQDFYLWKPNAQQINSSKGWQEPYKVVYNANLALETLNSSGNSLDQRTSNILKGTALFFRAYAHFQVAQSFAKPYDPSTAAQDMGVPIQTSTSLGVVTERGTVQQTYSKIIDDFNQALDLLPLTSTIKSRPNKVAVYAALARTYLSMSDYVNAGKMADACLKLYSTLIDYNTISKTSNTPFPRFNDEVIFQSIMSGGLPPVPIRGKINIDLYNSYDVNDIRKDILFKPTTGGFKFSGNYEPATSNSFFNGLATDEVFLIRAECYARLGNTVAAMADLNSLMQKRWSNTVPYVNITAGNSDEALRKILLERRKELLFRGLRWTDLRRLNKDNRFKVNLKREIGGVTYTLPANDLRYVLLIPKQVIDNSTIQQNPR